MRILHDPPGLEELLRAMQQRKQQQTGAVPPPVPSPGLHHYEDIGPKPAQFQKPKIGTPSYAIAFRAGWITPEEEQADRLAYEARRDRSLQACHYFSLYERPRHPEPADTGAYVPQLSARLDNDRNLTDGARRCARKLAEETYRHNREGRFIEITVTYLMEALHKSRRTIQRYLRMLEREGYIRTDVIRGLRSRLCTGLEIALLKPLFTRHHQQQWPSKRANPEAPKESQNKDLKDISKDKQPRIPVHKWAVLCMDGVFRAFMKTDPLGLMETAPPG